MSYVRTKDGKIVKVSLEGDVFTSKYEIVGEPKDTIEELCDEFVYVDEGCYPEINDELDLMQTSSTIIYAAIWTDKGLIYVAKINNEGKLCIL